MSILMRRGFDLRRVSALAAIALVILLLIGSALNMSSAPPRVGSAPPSAAGITCPADVTAPTDSGHCTAAVTFPTPIPSGGATSVSCLPASGSAFPLGVNTVRCTAADAAGHTDACTFRVTVSDAEPPLLTCPASATLVIGADCQIPLPNLTTGLSVSDNCTAPSTIRLEQSPAAGTLVGPGTANVTITATDAAGNRGNCTVALTAVDKTPPSLMTPPDITVPTTSGLCSAVVSYASPTATDNCTATVLVTCSPASGTTLPAGAHTINCRAADAAGNISASNFSVTVHDVEPPHITCPPDASALANSPEGAVAIFGQPVVSDNCGAPTLACDHTSGSVFPVGDNIVTCSATDSAGGIDRCTLKIAVRGPAFNTCARDDASGSFFRTVTRPGTSPYFGYWEYHLIQTGAQEEIFFGFANSVKVSPFQVITIKDTSSIRFKLDGELNPFKQEANIAVKKLDDGKTFKLRDTGYSGACH